jgi:hypothetical protein
VGLLPGSFPGKSFRSMLQEGYPNQSLFEVEAIGFDPLAQEGRQFRKLLAFGSDKVEVVIVCLLFV